MKNFYYILIFFLCLKSYGQEVFIDTLKINLSERFAELQPENSNNFPLINTGNKEIDSLINYDTKNRLTQFESEDEKILSSINKWAESGLIFLDFEITYLKNDIISYKINLEGCGAYCTTRTDYFNYSIKTGKFLEINSILEIEKLREKIIKEKDEQYESQKKKLKDLLKDEEANLDQDTFEFVLNRYNECQESFQIDRFALHKDYIQIIEECSLPHVISPLIPVIELKFYYDDIREYLKL